MITFIERGVSYSEDLKRKVLVLDLFRTYVDQACCIGHINIMYYITLLIIIYVCVQKFKISYLAPHGTSDMNISKGERILLFFNNNNVIRHCLLL